MGDVRRTRQRPLLLLMVLVLAGGACGTDRAESSSSDTVPERVQAMWRETAPWVAVGPPTPLLVPGHDLPASVRVEAIARPTTFGEPATSASAVPEPGAAAQTLYADPGSAAPWADGAVMVGRVPASDIEGFFNYGEGSAVQIQGRPGRVGQDGGLWFAAWSIPTCDVCDQEAFVIGHGLTRQDVLAIAESVRQEPTPQADPATLPAGLRSLGSAPGALGWVVTNPSSEELVMRTGDTEATLQVWSGDPRLYAHLAFWSRDQGPLGNQQRGWATVVDHGDDVIALTAGSVPAVDEAAALQAAAQGLVPGNDQEVEGALDEVIANLEPLESTRNLCWTDDGPWETFSGVVDDTRWGVTLMLTDGDSLISCDYARTASSAYAAEGGGGGKLGPVGQGGVRFAAGGSTGLDDGRSIQVVTGDVPATAVKVRVENGGRTVDVTPGEVGPAPGRRWFATAFLHDELTVGTRPKVTALDASGATVATGTSG